MALTSLGMGPPNLPIPPNQYSRIYQEQFSNALRLFVNAITNKLNASEVVDADDIDQGLYSRFFTISNQSITRNADGTVNTITHTSIDDGEEFMVQTYSYNASGQVSGCVTVDSSLVPSITITETFTYTGDAITAVTVNVE